MKKIINFVKFDFHSVSIYFKNTMFMLGLSLFIAVLSSLTTGIIMLGVYIIAVSSYPFILSERGGFSMLSGSLPLSRHDFVRGRYGFAVVMNIVFLVIASVEVIAVCAAKSIIADIPMYLLAILAASLYVAFSISLQYIVMFKFGYSKSKFITVAPIALVFAIFGAFASIVGFSNLNFYEVIIKNGEQLIGTAIRYFPLLLAAMVVLSAMLYAGAVAISQRIYAKKEF